MEAPSGQEGGRVTLRARLRNRRLQENCPAEPPGSLLLTHTLLASQRNKKKGAPKRPLDSSPTPKD